MKQMKIAMSEGAKIFKLQTKREVIDIKKTNFIDICSVLLTQSDTTLIQKVKETGFGIPIFVIIDKLDGEEVNDDLLKQVKIVIDDSPENVESYNKKIEYYSNEYEKKVVLETSICRNKSCGCHDTECDDIMVFKRETYDILEIYPKYHFFNGCSKV